MTTSTPKRDARGRFLPRGIEGDAPAVATSAKPRTPRTRKPKSKPVPAPELAPAPEPALTGEALFLQRLRETNNVSRSARDAGLVASTLYKKRQRHKGFAAEWDAALAEALDTLEDVLMRRATHGVERPVFFGGAQVGSVTSYSDNLAMFMLRSRRPEIYARSTGADQAASAAMTQAEAKAEVLRRLDRLAAGTAPDDAPAPDETAPEASQEDAA